MRANFGFDSLVMEEAAQVTEIETLIPLLLQVRRRRQTRDAATLKEGARARARSRRRVDCVAPR